jgi:hypothetical protein
MNASELDARIRAAIRRFWAIRQDQARRQGRHSSVRDAGERSAVTGGAQMNGFVELVRELLIGSGVPEAGICFKTRTEIPGWYRPEKAWDLLVIIGGKLIAAIEFKSHVGPSFGNNYNNRTEEALGSATDLLAAFREGAFAPTARPWLGYLMLLEDCEGSTRPIRNQEPHFAVFPEFRHSSYATRYEILLTKLIRERLYDGACLVLSDRQSGLEGAYSEPVAELSFRSFAESLMGRALASVRL